MGKIKRPRQKLHQSSFKANKDAGIGNIKSLEEPIQLLGKSPLLKSAEELAAVPDNLFEGIDINFEDLKKKLDEDDRVSVRSIAKSCKYDSQGKLLTKKEKQKLKHDLFMRKINTVQQLKKEALQKGKKRKGLQQSYGVRQSNLVMNKQDLVLSSADSSWQNETKLDVISPFKTRTKTQSRPIKKSKVRQKEMLQDISAFRKILNDPKFVKNPCAAITESVQERILGEKANTK